MNEENFIATVETPVSNAPSRKWQRCVLALACASLVISSIGTAHAVGASEGSARASEMSVATLSTATGVLVVGSLSAVVLSGQAVVTGIEAVGESVVVTVAASAEGVSAASGATLRLSGRAAQEAGVAVGSVLMVSAVTTGIVLRSAGRIVCFIPNERGRALIRSRQVGTKPVN